MSSVFHVSKGSPAATSPVAPSRAAEALTGVTWATCHKGLFMTCYGFVVQATKKQMTRFEPILQQLQIWNRARENSERYVSFPQKQISGGENVVVG